jgi:hypothetical protein
VKLSYRFPRQVPLSLSLLVPSGHVVLDHVAPLKLAVELYAAPLRLAPLRLAPLRLEPFRIAPAKLAPARSGPLRLAPFRFAPARLAPLRSRAARLHPASVAHGVTVTISVTTGDVLGSKPGSPMKLAVMLCPPADPQLSVQVALPAVIGCASHDQTTVPLSAKVTFPTGTAGLTVAVKVTF